MEQPSSELIRLEKILSAYTRIEDKQAKADAARQKNRSRHQPTKVKR